MLKKLMTITLITAMMISAFPINIGLATTENLVNKVPTVIAGTEFVEADAPYIRIEEESPGEFAGADQEFELVLINATWPADAGERLQEAAIQSIPADISFNRVSDSKVAVAIRGVNTDTEAYFVKIPLISTVLEEGTAKCAVHGMESWITDGTYTYAKVEAEQTGIRVGVVDVVDIFSAQKTFTLPDIFIEEKAAGALRGNGADGENPINIVLKLSPGLKFASPKVNADVFGAFYTADFKSRMVRKNQMVIQLDASDRNLLLKGGITLSDIKVSGQQMKRSDDMFMTISVESGNYNGEEKLYLGTYTYEGGAHKRKQKPTN